MVSGRGGYALLATLWVCAGIGALTLLISVSARETMATSRNRMAMTTATWQAQACVAYSREVIRGALAQEAASAWDSTLALWNRVDRVLAEAPEAIPGCELSARAVGSRLDVNASDEATVSRVLRAAGLRAPQADSAAAALADWIDADDDSRSLGAERAWYESRGRVPPSNTPFVDARELRRVRGLETVAAVDSVLDIEPGAPVLNSAPAALLAILPGFTDRTIQEVLDARRRGTPIMSFHALSALLDPQAPDASAKLPGLMLLTPNAWVITARTRSGSPPVTAVLQVRLSRGGGSTIISRRRSWIE